jgi:hypothetical protein
MGNGDDSEGYLSTIPKPNKQEKSHTFRDYFVPHFPGLIRVLRSKSDRISRILRMFKTKAHPKNAE